MDASIKILLGEVKNLCTETYMLSDDICYVFLNVTLQCLPKLFCWISPCCLDILSNRFIFKAYNSDLFWNHKW